MTGSLPRDAWYAVGGTDDLPPGMATAVSLFGEDIAAWRGQSGRVHAWDNRCVHRGMRLSFGRVRGDRLICAYHGWNYDETGRCRSIPARPDMKPSEKIAMPRHGATDRDGLLWIGLDGTSGTPPDLASFCSDGASFAFVQSIVLPRPAEALEERLRSVVFPPVVPQTEQPCWRYWVESRGSETARLRWSCHSDRGDSDRVVDYRTIAPYPGLFVIAAEASDFREARLLALQPQNPERSALHLMVSADGAEASATRATALWGRRLCWFLVNGGDSVQAYNPWLQREDVL